MASILQTLNRLQSLRKDLSDITKLSEEALSVFYPRTSAARINGLFHTVWESLLKWNRVSNGTSKHFGHMKIQSYAEVRQAFLSISDASINKEQLSTMLSETTEGIEKYIEELQAEIEKEEHTLSELYDTFARSCGNLAFIFDNSTIKDLIINQLLNSTIQ